MPDGRVLYMRWEYVDRSQVHFHHLWTHEPRRHRPDRSSSATCSSATSPCSTPSRSRAPRKVVSIVLAGTWHDTEHLGPVCHRGRPQHEGRTSLASAKYVSKENVMGVAEWRGPLGVQRGLLSRGPASQGIYRHGRLGETRNWCMNCPSRTKPSPAVQRAAAARSARHARAGASEHACRSFQPANRPGSCCRILLRRPQHGGA